MEKRNLIVFPKNYQFTNEVEKLLENKDYEKRVYTSLSTELKEIKEIQGDYNRIIFINDDGIAPFMYFSKIPGVVAAPIYDEHSSFMTASHNNCHIMCIGVEVTTPIIISSIINIFFKTSYEGERHKSRIDMMDLETKGVC